MTTLWILVCLAANMHKCAAVNVAQYTTVTVCDQEAVTAIDAWRPQHPGWAWLLKQCIVNKETD